MNVNALVADQLLAQLDLIAFGVVVMIFWGVRHWLIEHPSGSVAVGLSIAGVGFSVIVWLPSSLDTHRLIASTLSGGLALLVIATAWASGERASRQRKSLKPLERRHDIQRRANQVRLSELARLNGASMAQVRRQLRIDRVSAALDRGIDREARTIERIEILKERIERLQ